MYDFLPEPKSILCAEEQAHGDYLLRREYTEFLHKKQ
jgi:hypothetical protein